MIKAEGAKKRQAKSYLKSFKKGHGTERPCDMPGCDQPGTYKAPKSKENVHEYYWFCLEHVQDYNKHWDFYKGMSGGEIEQHIRSDTTWDRPSWPFGLWQQKNPFTAFANLENFYDPFRLFQEEKKETQPAPPKIPKEVQEALSVMSLNWPVTPEVLKKRYHTLAKKLHPDRSKDKPENVILFKKITHAYEVLKKFQKESG